MSDKPTEVADWTPTGADVVIPTAGEKSDGFQGAQRPPAQFINWFWELTTQWIVWFAAGLFTRNDPDDDSPVVGFTDSAGNIRQWIDPNGYFFGPAVQKQYVPAPVSIAASQTFQQVVDDLYGSTDANCLIDQARSSEQLDGMNGGGVKLTCENAAVSQRAVIHRSDGTFDNSLNTYLDDVVMVVELPLLLRTIGANGVDVHIGVHSNPSLNSLAFASGSSNGFCMFEKLSADTNWFTTVGDGSGESRTDSSVPPVVDTWQTFRMEYHGKATPVGVDNSDAVARFFIDGVRVREDVGGSVPDDISTVPGLDIVVRCRADSTGPASDFEIRTGPIRYAFNTRLTPDVPA